MIIAIFGIVAGWFFTIIYSRSTERNIDKTTSQHINNNVQPIMDILSRIDNEFDTLTSLYKNYSIEELKKLKHNDVDKLIFPAITMIEDLNKDFKHDNIEILISKAYENENQDLLNMSLFLGSLAKLESNLAPVAYRELSCYSPEMFIEFYDYILVRLLTLHNFSWKIFLLMLLR